MNKEEYMSKESLISMIESLNEKKKAAKSTIRSLNTVAQVEHTTRYIKRIESVCDRLCFNWNMLPESLSFFENTLAEAELFLS